MYAVCVWSRVMWESVSCLLRFSSGGKYHAKQIVRNIWPHHRWNSKPIYVCCGWLWWFFLFCYPKLVLRVPVMMIFHKIYIRLINLSLSIPRALLVFIMMVIISSCQFSLRWFKFNTMPHRTVFLHTYTIPMIFGCFSRLHLATHVLEGRHRKRVLTGTS